MGMKHENERNMRTKSPFLTSQLTTVTSPVTPRVNQYVSSCCVLLLLFLNHFCTCLSLLSLLSSPLLSLLKPLKPSSRRCFWIRILSGAKKKASQEKERWPLLCFVFIGVRTRTHITTGACPSRRRGARTERVQGQEHLPTRREEGEGIWPQRLTRNRTGQRCPPSPSRCFLQTTTDPSPLSFTLSPRG